MNADLYTKLRSRVFRAQTLEDLASIEAEYDAATAGDPQPFGVRAFQNAVMERRDVLESWRGFPVFDLQEVAPRLREEFGYSDAEAELARRWLRRRSFGLWGTFVQWWYTGEIETVERQGYSLTDLIYVRGLTPPAAICALIALPEMPSDMRAILEHNLDPIRVLAAVEAG